MKIMFVCHGNICRSPMAEFIFKDMLGKRGLSECFSVSSCATSTEEIYNGVGNPVYPPAKKELQMHRTLKDNNLKVRALRRARELREVLASLFFLALFMFLSVHSTIKPPLSTIMVENQRR